MGYQTHPRFKEPTHISYPITAGFYTQATVEIEEGKLSSKVSCQVLKKSLEMKMVLLRLNQ